MIISSGKLLCVKQEVLLLYFSFLVMNIHDLDRNLSYSSEMHIKLLKGVVFLFRGKVRIKKIKLRDIYANFQFCRRNGIIRMAETRKLAYFDHVKI